MSNRNRTAGHNYEREIVNRINETWFTSTEGNKIQLFPEVGTTRSLSVAMDANKVDITTVIPKEQEALGVLIQAKNTTSTVSYPKLLAEMEKARDMYSGTPIIFHKQTKRVGDRFIKSGEYAILNMKDFEDLFIKGRVYKKVMDVFLEYFDTLDKEVQQEISEVLKIYNL